MSIKGQTALITGGTKNLGADTARALAKLGANLFLHYNSSTDGLDDLVKELESEGVKVVTYQGKFTSAGDVTKFFDAATKAFPKGIDIAINNIGQVLKKPIVDITEEEFDSVDLINNKIAFFFLKEAAKNVNENGRVVSLVTSLLAAYTPYYSAYQGNKSAVEYYSKALSKELGSKSITVNNVAPGPMDTPFLYGQETDEAIAYLKSQGNGGRLTEVKDIVPIIKFLVTEGTWITGQTIYASGGFTAH